MDPLTQGVVGASLPLASARRRDIVSAAVLGFLAGMAPDLDVLIRSSEDPLLFLEYHRQFTHALVFIPIGGLICAMVLHALAAEGAFDKGLAVRTMTLPDRFIEQASPDEMYADAELRRTDIVATAMQALGRRAKVAYLA